MPELHSPSLRWKQITDLCRRHLEPEEIRRLDIHIWQEILAQLELTSMPAVPPENGRAISPQP